MNYCYLDEISVHKQGPGNSVIVRQSKSLNNNRFIQGTVESNRMTILYIAIYGYIVVRK